jgi:hypothetical protein
MLGPRVAASANAFSVHFCDLFFTLCDYRIGHMRGETDSRGLRIPTPFSASAMPDAVRNVIGVDSQ